jgi:uncharacterized membrane protein
MLFFVILAGAFVLALVLPSRGGRRSVRDAARLAMAAAMVFAGASHFAIPDPFVQHLPEWVPYRLAIIYATGAVEILLGAGLVGPARSRRYVALALAAYLVAVFPGNIHVAVAGVDVEGQPGGVYPWLRLAFQPLFIWWALWSTPEDAGDRRQRRPATRVGSARGSTAGIGRDQVNTAFSKEV